MRTPTKIGSRDFLTKKEALLHYKNILNSYKFGQSLNDSDYTDLLDLLAYEHESNLAHAPYSEIEPVSLDISTDTSNELLITDILVSKV